MLAVSTATVLAIVAALGWSLTRGSESGGPDGLPRLRGGESYGIDVSSHQGTIDWPRVKADGIGFAYLKASEGGDFTDARFTTNWSGAASAGIARGAYHFFTLCRPGREQAEQFLRVAPPDANALPPAVDLELIGNCATRPSAGTVAAELTAFVTRVEAAWRRPLLLYIGPEWAARYPLTSLDRPRWVKAATRPPKPWTIWQPRALANVDGIAEPVDLDIGRVGELRSHTS